MWSFSEVKNDTYGLECGLQSTIALGIVWQTFEITLSGIAICGVYMEMSKWLEELQWWIKELMRIGSKWYWIYIQYTTVYNHLQPNLVLLLDDTIVQCSSNESHNATTCPNSCWNINKKDHCCTKMPRNRLRCEMWFFVNEVKSDLNEAIFSAKHTLSNLNLKEVNFAGLTLYSVFKRI